MQELALAEMTVEPALQIEMLGETSRVGWPGFTVLVMVFELQLLLNAVRVTE